MALTGAERSKQVRQKRLHNNMCPRCGQNPWGQNRQDCDTCYEGHKQRINRMRSEHAIENVCTMCGGDRGNSTGKRCEECIQKRNKWYKTSNYKDRHAKIRLENRLKVVAHYGGKCECCGETQMHFLAIDHPNDDGNRDRKTKGFGSSFYAKLVRDNFPPGYRVLCHNCNFGRHLNGGICPHKVR